MTVEMVTDGVVEESDDEVALDIQSVLQATREFDTISSQKKALTKRETELKTRLTGLVQIEGEPDAKGNLLWPLPEQCGTITALQLQCRVSRPFDGDVAEQILRSIKSEGFGGGNPNASLWDECVTYVPVLDEDSVMAAHYDGHLTEAQIDEMYPANTTYAFVPVRVK